MAPPDSGVVNLKIEHIAENCAGHLADTRALRKDVDEIKIWIARFEGRIAGWAAAGGLLGALAPYVVKYLTGGH